VKSGSLMYFDKDYVASKSYTYKIEAPDAQEMYWVLQRRRESEESSEMINPNNNFTSILCEIVLAWLLFLFFATKDLKKPLDYDIK
jgi:hypothetical protein